MPGQPKASGWESGKAPLPIRVVTTGISARSARSRRPGVDRAPTDVEDRSSRGFQRLGRGGAPIGRRRFGDGDADGADPHRVRDLDRSLLDVTRDVDQHRPRPALAGESQRRLEDLGEIDDVLDLRGPFHQRPDHGDDVALLEGVGADQFAAHLSGEAEQRRRVHLRVARAYPSAMCPAPCSWRARTWRISVPRAIAS
jgi:hypothetical protein